MKPSKDFLSMYCICDFIKTQDHLSISDMSQDCEYTWSKDMPGPTGKPGGWSGGWAFYSTVENCAEIANGDNFYPESPGKIPVSITTASTSTTTASTTFITSTSTSTSTISTSTHLDFTTTSLKCCSEKVDRRNISWSEMCPDAFGDGNMIQNKTDGCPEGTKGYAFWTCDPTSGEFKPKQVGTSLEK